MVDESCLQSGALFSELVLVRRVSRRLVNVVVVRLVGNFYFFLVLL